MFQNIEMPDLPWRTGDKIPYAPALPQVLGSASILTASERVYSRKFSTGSARPFEFEHLWGEAMCGWPGSQTRPCSFLIFRVVALSPGQDPQTPSALLFLYTRPYKNQRCIIGILLGVHFGGLTKSGRMLSCELRLYHGV